MHGFRLSFHKPSYGAPSPRRGLQHLRHIEREKEEEEQEEEEELGERGKKTGDLNLTQTVNDSISYTSSP